MHILSKMLRPHPCPYNIYHHNDVTKWKHFPHYLTFVRGIHRSAVTSSHKGQWHRASESSLICAWTNDCINNGEAGDLRCHRAYYDVTVMTVLLWSVLLWLYYLFSYTLSREYRVVRNRNSRLLYANEDRLCANLRVHEQWLNATMPVPRDRVTSQINPGDVTMLSQKRPSMRTMTKWAIDDCF